MWLLAFPLHIITPATTSLMTFQHWFLQRRGGKLPICARHFRWLSQRTTMGTSRYRNQNIHSMSSHVRSFFSPTVFSVLFYANSSLTVRALDFQSQLRDCRPNNDCALSDRCALFSLCIRVKLRIWIKMASKLPQGRGCDGSIEDALRKMSDEQLMGEFDDIYQSMPVTDDTSCGWGFLRGPKTQK